MLTAIKLINPAASSVITDAIKEALKMEEEQTQTIMTLGASLTEDKLKNVFQAFSTDKNNSMPTPYVLITKEIPELLTFSPQPTITPSPEPTENSKVSAFLEEQEKYSNYAIPANVCYDYKKLPFEYESPVEGSKSSGFGYRLHPIQNEIKYHYGTDLAANVGEEIHAFADGKIYAVGENDSFGKYVIVDHIEGYRTIYAHCSKHCVSCGSVKKGDVIALAGETGAATGPHLHFELMHDGVYINPEFYI